MSENTYLLDPEDETEMVRLTRQGRLYTQFCGLLPPNVDLLRLPSVLAVPLEGRHVPRVLDLGCATGEWALALSAKYHQVEVFAIDISERMIAYAQEQAAIQELPDVHFLVGDVLKPFPFLNESFDVIHLRIANGFIPRTNWEDVFRECWRVLRPNGILISTEPETGTTTYKNPATAQIMQWLAKALYVRGLGFWDGFGSQIGILAMQPEFFKTTRFEYIEIFPYVSYASIGSPNYHAWLEAAAMMIKGIESLVINGLGVSKEEFDCICEKSRLEELQDSYQLYTTIVSVTGRKVKKA